jgi:transcriptional antiterminator RfaH
MPLLPPEPFVFPEQLFTDPSRLPEDASGEPWRWWVMHTRPRAEKSLARRCLERGVPFFLPLYQRRWRTRGQQKSRLLSSHLPLFPGYVFVGGDDQARLAALQTKLVARCLHVSDQAQLHADLTRVHQLMAAQTPLVPEGRLLPGMWVEISDGPLAGLQGKIIRRGKRCKFFVEVNFLQRGASVEIDGWMIRPSSDPCGAWEPAEPAVLV